MLNVLGPWVNLGNEEIEKSCSQKDKLCRTKCDFELEIRQRADLGQQGSLGDSGERSQP